jgi:hypothetical protein
MKKLLLTFFMALLACSFAIPANAARTTRDLVFEDDDADTTKKSGSETTAAGATAEKTLAVKTTLQLTRDGQVSTVVPSHEFKSGDKVKLVYTPNIDGYVYWMSKGSSGEYSIVFPTPKTGMDNKVERNKEYTIPVKGALKFDDKPGNEELLCILSPTALPDMDKAVLAAVKEAEGRQECEETPAASNTGKRSTRDLVFDEDEGKSANKEESGKTCVKKTTGNAQAANTGKRSTRDLVFDEDETNDVNTQSQTTKQGKPMVAHYTLVHK